MNPNNYASLAASKRLVEAGIVLETDCIWVKWYSDNYPQGEWRLMYKALIQVEEFTEQYPAACFTEVWMELPATIPDRGLYAPMKLRKAGDGKTWGSYFRDGSQIIDSIKADTNPTDALIDLLIWVRREKLNGRNT